MTSEYARGSVPWLTLNTKPLLWLPHINQNRLGITRPVEAHQDDAVDIPGTPQPTPVPLPPNKPDWFQIDHTPLETADGAQEEEEIAQEDIRMLNISFRGMRPRPPNPSPKSFHLEVGGKNIENMCEEYLLSFLRSHRDLGLTEIELIGVTKALFLGGDTTCRVFHEKLKSSNMSGLSVPAFSVLAICFRWGAPTREEVDFVFQGVRDAKPAENMEKNGYERSAFEAIIEGFASGMNSGTHPEAGNLSGFLGILSHFAFAFACEAGKGANRTPGAIAAAHLRAVDYAMNTTRDEFPFSPWTSLVRCMARSAGDSEILINAFEETNRGARFMDARNKIPIFCLIYDLCAFSSFCAKSGKPTHGIVISKNAEDIATLQLRKLYKKMKYGGTLEMDNIDIRSVCIATGVVLPALELPDSVLTNVTVVKKQDIENVSKVFALANPCAGTDQQKLEAMLMMESVLKERGASIVYIARHLDALIKGRN